MNVRKLLKEPLILVREALSGGHARLTATDLLAHQHRQVELLFVRLERAHTARERRPLLDKLADKLAAHMVIEQEIFYPTAYAKTRDEDLLLESLEEHGVARFELDRLLETGATGESFVAKVRVLRELVRHHVNEEENTLFPKVEKALDHDELEALGARLKARFDAAMKLGRHGLQLAAHRPAAINSPAKLAAAARRRSVGGQSHAAANKKRASRRGKTRRSGR